MPRAPPARKRRSGLRQEESLDLSIVLNSGCLLTQLVAASTRSNRQRSARRPQQSTTDQRLPTVNGQVNGLES
jgi:hypothetical protein